MIRLIRDRGWKGDYLDIPRAAACRLPGGQGRRPRPSSSRGTRPAPRFASSPSAARAPG